VIRTGSEPTIDEAAAVLAAGGVIGMPTDTVYGLAAISSSSGAMRRIFQLKGRPRHFALPVLVSNLGQAADLVGRVDPRLQLLGERFWPGALTIVVRPERAPAAELGGDGKTLGIRCPDHEVARALCSRIGPLAVTSANRHGDQPATTAVEVEAAFDGAIDMVLDGGKCDHAPSTVVSLVGRTPICLRVGEISLDDVIATLQSFD